MKKLILSCLIAAAVMTGCKTGAVETIAAQEEGNAVIEAIMARRSIRAYQEKAVPDELLQTIAECGVNAPNAMNAQNWEVRIINNPELIAGFTASALEQNPRMGEREGFKNIFCNAPAVICVAIKRDANPFVEVDAGLMGENMMIAAQSLGLGTVCLGMPLGVMKNATEYYERLNISPDYDLAFVIGVGYPAESPDARPRDLGKIQFVK